MLSLTAIRAFVLIRAQDKDFFFLFLNSKVEYILVSITDMEELKSFNSDLPKA